MSERERIREIQVKALADRLAMALAIMQECEIDCGIAGDTESEEWWQQRQRMLVGKDDEALQFARDEQRRYGNFYKLAQTRVREWLSRGVKSVKAKKAA